MPPDRSASLITQQFWKIFGQYMSPVPSASGDKINWINYKTTVRHVRIIMKQHEGNMIIALELSNPDMMVQLKEFKQLLELKNDFFAICGNDWLWFHVTADKQDKTNSSISSTLYNVSILKEEDWSEIISFLKKQLIALDDFWNNFKYLFQF